jgi:hypothetical protein
MNTSIKTPRLIKVRTVGGQMIPNIQTDDDFWNWDYPKRRDWLKARFPEWTEVYHQANPNKSNTPTVRVVTWGKTINSNRRHKTVFGDQDCLIHGRPASKALRCHQNALRPGINPRRAKMWSKLVQHWIDQAATTGNLSPDRSVYSGRFIPTPEQKAAGIVTPNACRCGICGGNADRHEYGFQCQKTPGHYADLNTGIFTDHTFPERE